MNNMDINHRFENSGRLVRNIQKNGEMAYVPEIEMGEFLQIPVGTACYHMVLCSFWVFHPKRSGVDQTLWCVELRDSAQTYSHSIQGRLGKKAKKSNCKVGFLAREKCIYPVEFIGTVLR